MIASPDVSRSSIPASRASTRRTLGCPLLAASCAGLIASCGASEPGRFRVVFGWSGESPDGPSLPDAAFVFGRVEERNERAEIGGTLLGEAVPAPFSVPGSLALSGITNGDNRVAIVEIRETRDPGSSLLYYGLSEPFSLWPGSDVTVEVYLELAPAPRAARSTDLTILELRGRGAVKDPAVTLAFDAARPDRIIVAKDLGLLVGRADVDPESHAVGSSTTTAGHERYQVPYDLNTGLCDPGACADGIRAVHVLVSGEAGRSRARTLYAQVVLDTVGPRVLPGSEGLHLVPRNSLLPSVRKIGVGTKVELSFTLDEAVAGTPTVATSAPEVIPFVLDRRSGTSFTFTLDLAEATHTQGSYTVDVTAEDRAGNIATRTLAVPDPGIVLDTISPNVPAVDLITYRRMPWGTASSPGTPRFLLEGAPGAAGPRDTLVVYGAADVASSAEIGRTTAGPDGAFAAFDLDPADRVDVYVVAVDDAGNVSDAAPQPGIQARAISRGVWTASLGGKIRGRTTPNPHGATYSHAFLPSLVQDSALSAEPDQASIDALAGLPGPPLTISGAPRWVAHGSSTVHPAPRYEFGFAYDTARGRAVLVNGLAPRLGVFRDTWEWNGLAWSERSPRGPAPTAGIGASMAYDSARGRVVFHSGLSDETWEWDGLSWALRRPSQTPGGSGNAMAYDSTRARVVLFGGASLRETWEWDGTTWTEMNPPAPIPEARIKHAMAYDAARARIVLVGGTDPTTNRMLDDHWEWDGHRWSRVSSARRPPPRSGHGLAWDSRRRRLVLFGGVQEDPTEAISLGDTWEWDGTSWSPAAVGQLGPQARFGPGLVYDVVRGRVVLFGGASGRSETEFHGDTWEWDGSKWEDRTVEAVSSGPSHRSGHAMASNGYEVLMFGGAGVSGPTDETWVWSERRGWTETMPIWRPTARQGAAAAYDRRRNRVVLFGGAPGAPDAESVWEWYPNNRSWINFSPGGPGPGSRQYHSMVYDGFRQKVILFGGLSAPNQRLGDLWEWDGDVGRWSAIPSAVGPPPRSGAAMAYDSARNRLLVFGGEGDRGVLGDTWEWVGGQASWAQLTPSGAPLPRTLSTMAYDSVRERAVLFGGRGIRTFGDTWVWDGTGWSIVSDSPRDPVARSAASMAYDGRIILFGGDSSAVRFPLLRDLWTWDGLGWSDRTPALSLSLSAPEDRNEETLAFDAARGRVVLFGGVSSPSSETLADTWEWDGSRWSAELGGPPRNDSTMAYDSTRRRIVLFLGDGNVPNSLWERDETGRWESRHAETEPPRRHLHAMAFDSVRGRVVMFGGSDSSQKYDDTWEWDGASGAWTLGPRGPPNRDRHAMTFDAARGVVLLFGGCPGASTQGGRDPCPALGDTWTYDGTSWTPAGLGRPGPPPRAMAAMSYDGTRRRVVLFGGCDMVRAGVCGTTLGDTWEWDGDRWLEQRTPAQVAQAVAAGFHAMTYDARVGRILRYGGASVGADGLTEWIADPMERPAIIFSVDWGAASVAAVPESVDLSVVAGGRGASAVAPGNDVPGAELLVWDSYAGAWSSWGSGRADISGPAPLHAAASAGAVSRLVTAEGTIHFALRPRAGFGLGAAPARISATAMELNVHYGGAGSTGLPSSDAGRQDAADGGPRLDSGSRDGGGTDAGDR